MASERKLIAHTAVEALHEGILDRLTWRNEVPVDSGLLAPGQHGITGELGTVVGDDRARQTVKAVPAAQPSGKGLHTTRYRDS